MIGYPRSGAARSRPRNSCENRTRCTSATDQSQCTCQLAFLCRLPRRCSHSACVCYDDVDDNAHAVRESPPRSTAAPSKSSPTRTPRDLQVRLRADSHADFRQWFYFRLQGARAQPVRIRFVNAGARDVRRRAGAATRRWRRTIATTGFACRRRSTAASSPSRTRRCATASTTRISSRTRGSAISRCWDAPMRRRAPASAISARRSKAAT